MGYYDFLECDINGNVVNYLKELLKKEKRGIVCKRNVCVFGLVVFLIVCFFYYFNVLN